MGMLVSTFVPCDATGRVVNLNIEYMYRDDGLKLEVLRFEYYRSTDSDYKWFVLTQEDKLKMNKYQDADRYKVSDLYVDTPTNANINRAIKDLDKVNNKLVKLKFNLVYGCVSNNGLLNDITQVHSELVNILKKLENSDAE